MKKITDKERLDWLEEYCAELQADISSKAVEDGEIWNAQPSDTWHANVRAAIDAAIRASRRKNGGR